MELPPLSANKELTLSSEIATLSETSQELPLLTPISAEPVLMMERVSPPALSALQVITLLTHL